MSDRTILEHINELVDEEHRLRDHTQRAEQHTARLRHVAEELDQCWDLLRQRRAKRDAGENPDDAHERDIAVVESYLN